jgi:hypothetical protein
MRTDFGFSQHSSASVQDNLCEIHGGISGIGAGFSQRLFSPENNCSTIAPHGATNAPVRNKSNHAAQFHILGFCWWNSSLARRMAGYSVFVLSCILAQALRQVDHSSKESYRLCTYIKVKLSLYTPWRPLGLREVEATTFSDIRLTDGGKAVSPMRRLLLFPRKIPGTHFCYRLSRPQGHSAAGRIKSIEKIHLIRDSNRRPSGL